MTTRPGPLLLVAGAAAAAALTIVLTGCGKAPDAAMPAPTASTTSDAASNPSSGAASGTNVADMDVTTNVQTALIQDPSLKGTDISVVTLKGDVRLTGFVDNQAQIESAIKIARAADGVHSIHDELAVKK